MAGRKTNTPNASSSMIRSKSAGPFPRLMMFPWLAAVPTNSVKYTKPKNKSPVANSVRNT